MDSGINVHDFVQRLKADLVTAKDQPRIVVERGKDPHFEAHRNYVAGLGWPAPETLDETVLINFPGEPPVVNLIFMQGIDWPEQMVQALDEVQTLVIENTLQAWPLCPEHETEKHWLEARGDGESVVWVCPFSENLVARFGELAEQGTRAD